MGPLGVRALPSRRRRTGWSRTLVGCCAILATLTSVVGLPGSAGAQAGPTASARTVAGPPPRALPHGARQLGALGSNTALRLSVVLAPRDPTALARFATEVSTPGNPRYHRYVTSRQFGATFGAEPSVVAAVRSWLLARGLRPGPTAGNDLSIPLVATAGVVSTALHTSFQQLRMASGRLAYRNTVRPEFPAGVQAVLGLDDLSVARPLGFGRRFSARFGPARAAATPRSVVRATTGPVPCAAATTVATSQGGYTADQLATAYGFDSLYNQGRLGAGVTVALVETEPFAPSDVAAYQSCYGSSAAVTDIPVDGGAGAGSGTGESILDIDNVIGLAPQTTLDVYSGPAGSDYDIYSAIVTQDIAQVISTSFGLCEPQAQGGGRLAAENTLFQQAAAQGQTFVAAAGDDGSEDCYTAAQPNTQLAVDDPGSQPYVTGVGGTSLSNPSSPPVEAVWNDGPASSAQAAGAAGGGISARWPMPAYQSGPGVQNKFSSGVPCAASVGDCREVPDVSASADPNFGYTIYYQGTWMTAGGTSGAAPLWAALVADVDTGCRATAGFLNPALYKAAAGGTSPFHDIATGNNDYTGTNSGDYPATAGFDLASGLGTPDSPAIALALCPQPAPSGAGTYTATAPTRILDTRSGSGATQGLPDPLSPATAYPVQVSGLAGVPSTATAVAVNIT
ncbi:MAG TPA: S53 family peptidase, partial [Mycobacteriales bacterium]|nr:S53 family peptidase [Mycobacteriales bacterium]